MGGAWCVLILLIHSVQSVPRALAPRQDNSDIDVVHVIQTCHLDVGFADTAAGELENYRQYLLDAAALAQDFHNRPGEHNEGSVFTTHSYIVSLLLDCPTGLGFQCPTVEERAVIIAAIQSGDIVLHAMPFNAEIATFPQSLFSAALNLTHTLATSLGVTPSRILSQRDVPGLTRAAIPALVAHDIVAVTVGVNTASLPPAVPKTFRWRDVQTDTEVIVMYHPYGYGGIGVDDCVAIPSQRRALCFDYNGDNAGPWRREDIVKHWAIIQQEFPNAKVLPSSYDEFLPYLLAARDTFPVVMSEIGDTWVYGIASDPLKLAQHRAMGREFARCNANGECSPQDARVANFSRLAIKNSEHTWGGDVKTILHDTGNWTNSAFHAWQRTAPNFVALTSTWLEQRLWGITAAVDALQDHSLRVRIEKAFAELRPSVPHPDTEGFSRIADPTQEFTVGAYQVAFSSSGAITTLGHHKSGESLASAAQPLGSLVYKVHSSAEYDAFFAGYLQTDRGTVPAWAQLDFGKPGMEKVVNESTKSLPTVQSLWHKSLPSEVNEFLLALKFPDILTLERGAPETVWLSVTLTPTETQLDIRFGVNLFNKTATRLPESLWMVFDPVKSGTGENRWTMNKLGQWVDPKDVVVNGSASLHAVDGIRRLSPTTRIEIESQDAQLLSWGGTNPFPIPVVRGHGAGQAYRGTEHIDHEDASFCLLNNIWGTNYVMWYPYAAGDENLLFRFSLSWFPEQ